MTIWLLTFYNEMHKRLLLLWNYKMNMFAQIFMMILIFVGVSYFLGGGQFRPEQVTSILVGYVLWFYARLVIMAASVDISTEAQVGTLEQLYMSPAPPPLLLLARLSAILLSSTVIVIVPTFLLITLLGIQIPLRWEGLVILVITLIGLLGLSFILSGAALVFKQIESLADLFQNALLLLTGSLLPIAIFPHWLGIIAQTLPITQGILVLREVVLQGESLVTVWNNQSLIWLIVNSVLYVVIGWIIYRSCEKYAKQTGSLGQY